MDEYRELPDFLTLNSGDALDPAPTNATFTWNIPSSYYSPDRSSTCYVTLVNCFCDPMGVLKNYLVVMKDGASNYSNTSNNGIVLGGLDLNAAASYNFQGSSSALQPLISSKPATITLEIQDLAGTLVALPAGHDLVVTLRFDYIAPKEQVAGMLSTFQPNLLGRQY